jgi:hypothetical protein
MSAITPDPEQRRITAAIALTAEARLTVEDASILIKHHMWIDWAWIAVNHLRLAEAARVRAVACLEACGNWAAEMAAETQAAMVTISAAVHALDALYGGLRRIVTMQQLAPDAARHTYIRTALTTAHNVDNGVVHQWKIEFTWLFGLRDSAAHPEEAFATSIPHPVSGNGSPEVAAYCVENARRAVKLLIDVLTILQNSKSARSEEVLRGVAVGAGGSTAGVATPS